MARPHMAAIVVSVAGGLLVAVAVWTGGNMLLVPAACLLVGGAVVFVRSGRNGATEFPDVEIQPECEWRTAYLRVTNLDQADTLSARVIRVTLENTLSSPPPWPIAWSDASGAEMLLDTSESQRLELGHIDPGEEGAPPEFRFARPSVDRGGASVTMPWPEGMRDEDHPDGVSRRHVRAEIEITSERTGNARLVQVRVGVVPPDWMAELHLVSIDFTDTRDHPVRDAA